LQNDSMENSTSTSSAEPTQTHADPKNWATPVFCALITTLGVIFTAYSTHVTQSEIEVLKAKSEEQVVKIKSDTEYQIKQAELRSQENILRLTNQLDTEKDQRAKITAAELAALTLRSKRCTEIKELRDEMSSKITHVRYNDPLTEDALFSLQAAANKSSSYLTDYGYKVLNSEMPKEKSLDSLQRQYGYFRAVLEGYNAELRIGCIK
jgi:hypothetical protein